MEEPEGSKVTSTQKSLASNHDPGWNDPPKWAFTQSETSCTTPTKRLLNKRVAFPLNSAPNTSNIQSQSLVSLPPNLPPPVSSQGKATVPSISDASKASEEAPDSKSTVDKEDSLNETLTNLEAAIEKHIQSETKTQEVKRRLEAMKIMWLNNKLDNQIYRKMLDLSRALKKEDVDKADKIHISLMMERASLCTSWIPGIRHLILEMKSKVVESNNETNDESGPSLISPLSLE